jgi:hypothetical protein
MLIEHCEEISANADIYPYKFSICTLVTKKHEYEEMLNTFYQKGFSTLNSEFLYIDNCVSNKGDGFAGLNKFLSKSQAKYIVVCHQDIRLDFDDIAKLEDCIERLESNHPRWAVLGNAGGSSDLSEVYCRISDPHGTDQSGSKYPIQVSSLDENFLIIKNGLHIGLSTDLAGFHFYGTDICLQASLRGYETYIIDFHLRHLSSGNPGKSFNLCKKALIKKYELALKPRFIRTTCTPIYVSGTPILNRILNKRTVTKFKAVLDKYLKP